MTYTLQPDIDRLYLQPVAEHHAAIVAGWRNTPSARAGFYTKQVVTPDTHIAFVRNRQPHDLVWMCYETPQNPRPIGMTSLTVDVDNYTAEYGRLYIPAEHGGKGYAKRIEWATLWCAFDWLKLNMVWLTAYADNAAVIGLHNKLGWVDYPHSAHQADHTEPIVEMRYYAEMWQRNKERIKP